MAALLSEADYSSMSNIEPGQVITITPRFYHKMFKGHAEYSFPFFLSLGETLCSSSETMYKSYARTNGEDYAERYWKSEYPLLYFIVLKRVVGSDAREVVRFLLYPHAMSELIESCYFEVAFDVYKNLFTALWAAASALFRVCIRHWRERIGEIITNVIQVTLKLLSLFPNATAFNSKAFNSVAGLLITDFTE